MNAKKGNVLFDDNDNLNLPEDGADFITPYAQVRNCAISGGDFTIVQDTIDSITTASATERWNADICPGIYDEKIVMKDFVSLKGVGTAQNTPTIRNATGDIVTVANLDGAVQNMRFDLEPTTDGQCIVRLPNTVTGEVTFTNCQFFITSTTPDITAKFAVMEGGTLRFKNCMFTYTMTGNGVTPKVHELFEMNNGVLFEFSNSRIFVNISDDQDDVSVFVDNVNTSPFFMVPQQSQIFVSMFSTSYTGTARVAQFNGAGGNDTLFKDNLIFMQTLGGGDAYAYDIQSGGILVNNNLIRIFGFDNNYHANVEAGAIISIGGDMVIDPTDGITGTGTVKGSYSQNEGELKVTDSLQIPEKEVSPLKNSTVFTNLTEEEVKVVFGGVAYTIPTSIYERAVLSLTVDQSIATGASFVAVDWDQEDIDVGDIHDNATNPSRITVTKAGHYLLLCDVQFDANAAGDRGLRFAKNGTAIDQTEVVRAALGGSDTFLDKAAFLSLAANDYVEAEVFQTGGGSLDLLSAGSSITLIRLY